ncbi:MAG: response regulator transcription factor [Anaerolineales bacterium]|nr:response regulator transcription factor [Anaerolineales bacterium]
MSEITVLIIDDHPLFRQGVADLLSFEADIRVIGQASNGEDAVRLIRELCPTVAILDINIPKLNGQQVMRQVINEKLPTRVVLLTAYDDVDQMVVAIRNGAAAYCVKSIEPERLLWTVRQVSQGYYVLGAKVFSRNELELWLDHLMLSGGRARAEGVEAISPLSEREMEVLAYITRGLSNKEIASFMQISHQTVKNHVTSILRKLDVEDRTQATIYALRQGWVRLHQDD